MTNNMYSNYGFSLCFRDQYNNSDIGDGLPAYTVANGVTHLQGLQEPITKDYIQTDHSLVDPF